MAHAVFNQTVPQVLKLPVRSAKVYNATQIKNVSMDTFAKTLYARIRMFSQANQFQARLLSL